MAEAIAPKQHKSEVDFTQPWDHSDVVFLMEDDKRVYASKTILAMWSPVLDAMFFHDFKEKDAGEVKLPGKKHANILELVKVVHPPNKQVDSKLYSGNLCAQVKLLQIDESWLKTFPVFIFSKQCSDTPAPGQGVSNGETDWTVWTIPP